MITITGSGENMLKATFPDAGKQTLRVTYNAACGCRAQPKMSLAPGTPKASDEVIAISGYTFCVDKDLLALTRGITISAYPDGRPFLTAKNPAI